MFRYLDSISLLSPGETCFPASSSLSAKFDASRARFAAFFTTFVFCFFSHQIWRACAQTESESGYGCCDLLPCSA